jgi:formylglycine-generating enzyme required for sulfatase activity
MLLAFGFACALAGAFSARAATSAATLDAMTTVDLGRGVTMEFVLVRPGTFLMGSAGNDFDEQPVHPVTLTRPYYIGRYEVTQEQWAAVLGDNPSVNKGLRRPVENVSWNDCQRFLAALRKKTGRALLLPTEAQWEYACRAGTSTTYGFGDDEAALPDYAWYASNAGGTTHPVGQKKPNRWGLYDMHGNVFEWCADWYSVTYPQDAATDPTGPMTGDRRTLRGGAALYVADNLRSADRNFSPPDLRSSDNGLRCVLLVDPEPSLSAGGAPSAPESRDQAANASVRAATGAEANRWLAKLDAAIAAADRFTAESVLANPALEAIGESALVTRRAQVKELPPPKRELSIDLGGGGTAEFVFIPAGVFQMGSDTSRDLDQRPAHRVTITRPFYLGKYEITQKQWSAVMSRNLSLFRRTAERPDGDTRPVENVTWELCRSFVEKANARLERYELRLPTEAEWEYACRAGSTGDYTTQGGAADLGRYAWYGANAEGQTHGVGLKAPNAWGLHDMYGNVWEWCSDEYGRYAPEPAIDPVGSQGGAGSERHVLRGGAWNSIPEHVNSVYRDAAEADMMSSYSGFRCVLVPKSAP